MDPLLDTTQSEEREGLYETSRPQSFHESGTHPALRSSRSRPPFRSFLPSAHPLSSLSVSTETPYAVFSNMAVNTTIDDIAKRFSAVAAAGGRGISIVSSTSVSFSEANQAFVIEFASVLEARAAVALWDGVCVDGLVMSVTPAPSDLLSTVILRPYQAPSIMERETSRERRPASPVTPSSFLGLPDSMGPSHSFDRSEPCPHSSSSMSSSSADIRMSGISDDSTAASCTISQSSPPAPSSQRPMTTPPDDSYRSPPAPSSKRPTQSSQGNMRNPRSQRRHNFVNCMVRLARRNAVDSRCGSTSHLKSTDGTLRLSADEIQMLAGVSNRLNASQSRQSGQRRRGAQHRS
jgi:hypothetical protein